MQLARILPACHPCHPSTLVPIIHLTFTLLTTSHDLYQLYLVIALQDVAYSIPGKAGAKHTIIQGITGYFEPGQMTAVVSSTRCVHRSISKPQNLQQQFVKQATDSGSCSIPDLVTDAESTDELLLPHAGGTPAALELPMFACCCTLACTTNKT
jgi:hypothetical protein